MTRRLRKLEVGALDEEQPALHCELARGPRAQQPQSFALCDEEGRLECPINAMLLRPALGGALQAMGAGPLLGRPQRPYPRAGEHSVPT